MKIIARSTLKGGKGSGWFAPPEGSHTGEKHTKVGSGKAGKAMAERKKRRGDGRHDKSTSTKVANLMVKGVSGARKLRGSSKVSSEVQVKGKAGRKRMESWLSTQGFESFRDPMKTDVFYSSQSGASYANGRFLVELSALRGGVTLVDITDMISSSHPLWQGQD